MEKTTWKGIGQGIYNNSLKPAAIRAHNGDEPLQFRYYETIDYASPGNPRNYFTIIQNARSYMNENFSIKISIEDIARHCFLSQFHFSRIFKAYTSVSPHQYLLNIRLYHAGRLIKETQLPITDICFQSGFSSLDYFSAAFTRKYKISPRKYRRSEQVELQ